MSYLFLSMQESVFWLLGTVVQCGVPIYIYVRLGGKGCSLSMALEIPVASKLGTPQVFCPQASCNWKPQFVADHINGPITKLYRRTMEPCTTTKTTTIIGRRLTSEHYQLETTGWWFGVLYLTTDTKYWSTCSSYAYS